MYVKPVIMNDTKLHFNGLCYIYTIMCTIMPPSLTFSLSTLHPPYPSGLQIDSQPNQILHLTYRPICTEGVHCADISTLSDFV